MPWELVFYAAFQEEVAARKFERYLKSGSGRAFAHKRLLSEIRGVQLVQFPALTSLRFSPYEAIARRGRNATARLQSLASG